MSPLARIFVVALCLSAGVSAFAGTVSGSVSAAGTRQPLGSKVVAAYDTAGILAATATTDGTGLYTLTLPGGSYKVLAYDPEGFYATAFDGNAESFETSPVTSVPATGSVTRDFTLVAGGIVSGVVTGPGGSPRVDAVVEAYNLSGTRRSFTTTNASGAYSLVLPPGEYKLVAYDANPAFAFTFYPGVRTFAEAARVAASATRPVTNANFQLDAAARVSGRVTDAATGAALPGVIVQAYTAEGLFVRETTTDATGTFRFSLPAGDYRFAAGDPARVYAPGYFGASRSFETSNFLIADAGASVTNIHFALVRGGTVSGRVRDAAGAPAGNVTVAAYNLDGTRFTSVQTKADGTYQLVLAPGAYKLAVFDPQLVYATRFLGGARDFATTGTAGVAAGQQVAGVNFTVVRGGRVTGTVRDGATPVAGITVAAYDASGLLAASATTTADGTYALVVPPGDYRIVAFDAGLTFAASYDGGANSYDETVPRGVAAGATVTADIALRRGGLVHGETVDAAGNLVDGVEIFALDLAGRRVGGAMSVSGSFSIAVPPGTYKFVAIDPRGRYAITYFQHAATLAAATPVTVRETPPAELRFVLDPAPLRRRGVRH